ncbi:MAG: FAD-dependent oxidoreductase, partial [Opitutaceae bacterium]
MSNVSPSTRREFLHHAATAAVLATAVRATGRAAAPTEAEVVVYGGTSGGVAAAVAAARRGRRVVLIEPGRHLGGLTSGGLGATDIGKKNAIGGISREFYQRVKKHYADPAAWKYGRPEDFRSHQHDPREDVMFYFEPHVAERIYEDLLREARVEVVRGERLDLRAGVERNGTEITAITMESGRRFRGRVFIDATYEGDLMAKAWIKFLVGREANSSFGETHNGNQPFLLRRQKVASAHDFRRAVDPYLRPGDPASGLIFG